MEYWFITEILPESGFKISQCKKKEALVALGYAAFSQNYPVSNNERPLCTRLRNAYKEGTSQKTHAIHPITSAHIVYAIFLPVQINLTKLIWTCPKDGWMAQINLNLSKGRVDG